MVKDGENFHKPIIRIEHFSLAPISREANKLSSSCPVCGEGVLAVGRDLETFVLKELDTCLLCGQRFQYTDICQLRARDWAKRGIGS